MITDEEQISAIADQLCAITEEIEQLEKQANEQPVATTASAAVTVEGSKKTTVENVKEVYAGLVS